MRLDNDFAKRRQIKHSRYAKTIRVKMRTSNLICPHCQTRLSAWRVITARRSLICPVCKTRLAFSPETAARTGAILGGVLVVALIPLLPYLTILVRSWYFWVFLVIGAEVVGRVVPALAGRLIEYEEALTAYKNWSWFRGKPDWQRKVWLVTAIGVPVCGVLLFFAPLLSIWLAVAITGLMGVFVILGLVVLWRRLFGKSGILRRSRFNDRGDQR